jgi:hypothetical protein
VAFLISIYQSALGLLDLWPLMRNATGLIIPGEKYVNRNNKCHRSNNPRGDICK